MALPETKTGPLYQADSFLVYITENVHGLHVFITNLADKLSELVQVTLSIWSDAQLPDATVKLLCSLKWILAQKHIQLCRVSEVK